MNFNLRRIKNSTLVLGLLFVTAGTFQNCSPGFETVTTQASTSSGSLEILGAKTQNPFVCSSPDQLGKSPLKRLTRVQYTNTLRALMGTTAVNDLASVISALYDDELKKDVSDFSNSITDLQMTAFQKVSEAIYSKVSASAALAASIGGSCLQSTTVTTTCRDSAIALIGRRAFRRPLTNAEITRWTQAYNLGGTAAEGLAWVLYGMTLSPSFTLHFEGGADSASDATLFNLTPYEVAARLSYGIADSPPDELLSEAANKGQLSTIDEVRPHVDRLLQSAEARSKVRRFVKYWVDPKRYPASDFLADFLKGIDVPSVNDEFEREMYEYVDYVIFTKKGSFNDLILGSESFARTPATASIYGHAPVTGSAPAKVSGDRKGLLMRTPVIAGDGNESRPVIRGAKFRLRFLCETLGLPVGAMTNDPTFLSDEARQRMSTRDRFAGLTSQGACMGCHSALNPVGFAFEKFDNFGRVREKERAYSSTGQLLAEHSIVTSSTGVYLSGQTVNINDGLELIEMLSQRNQLPGCFIKQVSRFYRIQTETPQDGCLLSSVYSQVMMDPAAPVLEAFRSQFLQPSLFKRNL